MARYIDADKLWNDRPQVTPERSMDYKAGFSECMWGFSKRIREQIDNPTAEIVPKSEYDKLICKLECLLCHVTGSRLSKHTYDLKTMETVATDCINETYNDGFGEGYKECAREIFEEIEKWLSGDDQLAVITRRKLAQIKKKYTESER